RKLSFSVLQTMRVAQGLYEKGYITYMRTDSVNLSQLAIDAAKEEIEKSYGKEFAHTRTYKTKSSSAQEAHEAIRPSNFSAKDIETDENNEKRLYDLIWKRAIASQMSDAEIEKTILTVGQNKSDETFVATGEVIVFEGFLKVYMESDDDNEDEDKGKESGDLLPMVKANDK